MLKNIVLGITLIVFTKNSIANKVDSALEEAASCAAFTKVIEKKFGGLDFVHKEKLTLDRIYENSFQKITFLAEKDGIAPAEAVARFSHYLEQHDFALSLGRMQGVEFSEATLMAFTNGNCAKFN